MATITVTQITPEPPLQIESGSTATFRGWYSNSYVAADGVTPVIGGNGQTGFFYEWDCTVDDNRFVVIPAITIQPTTESNPTAGFFGAVFVNGSFTQMVIGVPQATAGWQIPTSPTTTTFGALAIYNAAVQLLYPPISYATYQQVLLAIAEFAGNFLYAAVGIAGITQLSWAPDSASTPIALGANDPRVGNLKGNLTVTAVPHATGTDTLADTPITYDGVDVSVQTLNNFQAGDVQDAQNGSYLNVNDGLGRANLFAGGGTELEPASQYSGVAATADDTSATIYVQSTDRNHLVGSSDGITKLGDTGENNGTMIKVDDATQQISLTNLPTSDPTVAGVLWNDAGVVKISAG